MSVFCISFLQYFLFTIGRWNLSDCVHLHWTKFLLRSRLSCIQPQESDIYSENIWLNVKKIFPSFFTYRREYLFHIWTYIFAIECQIPVIQRRKSCWTDEISCWRHDLCARCFRFLHSVPIGLVRTGESESRLRTRYLQMSWAKNGIHVNRHGVDGLSGAHGNSHLDRASQNKPTGVLRHPLSIAPRSTGKWWI